MIKEFRRNDISLPCLRGSRGRQKRKFLERLEEKFFATVHINFVL